MKSPLVTSVVLAAAIAAFPVRAASQTEMVVDTTLSAIRAKADAFRDVWVRFPVQFCTVGRVYNPFFTVFTPAEFVNFHAWADEQKLWTQADYDAPFAYLFVSKRSELSERLFTTPMYGRFLCTGVVRSTFQGTPWIEVTAMERLDRTISTEALAHIYRAGQLMEARRWALAAGELTLAQAGRLPDRAAGWVHRMLGVCHLRVGEADKAATHLAAAARLLPGDPETAALARLARQTPEVGFDPVSTVHPLKDSERPLWEAFDRRPEEPSRATPPPGPAR